MQKPPGQERLVEVHSELEKFFYGWGGLVADHPFKIIVLCIFVTACCSVGFLSFR